jgi:hypothetical protein
LGVVAKPVKVRRCPATVILVVGKKSLKSSDEKSQVDHLCLALHNLSRKGE